MPAIARPHQASETAYGPERSTELLHVNRLMSGMPARSVQRLPVNVSQQAMRNFRYDVVSTDPVEVPRPQSTSPRSVANAMAPAPPLGPPKSANDLRQGPLSL
eukprot:818274-Lingulodinium_polyedra.AAC.1